MAMKKQELKIMVSVSEEVDTMVEEYLSRDQDRRTAYFTKTAYEKALLERKNNELTQALKEKNDVLSMAETAPIAWKMIVKDYFSDFSIDNGGCIAIGKWASSYKKYVTGLHGENYFLEKGRYMHLYNYLMGKAEKSNAIFFKEIRRNATLWMQLQYRIEEFSKVVFFREMQIALLKFES